MKCGSFYINMSTAEFLYRLSYVSVENLQQFSYSKATRRVSLLKYQRRYN